jgi:hypothetical protein
MGDKARRSIDSNVDFGDFPALFTGDGKAVHAERKIRMEGGA